MNNSVLEMEQIRVSTFGCRIPILLYNQLIQAQLLCRSLKHAFLHAPICNETEDVYLLCLTNAVCTIHRLKICLRIPVAVVEYNNVCSGEVDTKPSSTRGKEEYKFLAVWFIVLVDTRNTILVIGTTINATIF
jgi:hypothetical protein